MLLVQEEMGLTWHEKAGNEKKVSNHVRRQVLKKLFNESSGSEVFGLFLGRILCLPEVDADGVRAPGRPF